MTTISLAMYALIVGSVIFARRYMRGVTDYLAAGRAAITGFKTGAHGHQDILQAGPGEVLAGTLDRYMGVRRHRPGDQ